jgi:Na+:H+ antiporter, NhaA family
VKSVTGQIRESFERFLQIEAASGFALLAATVAALIWANTSGPTYEALWGTPLRMLPDASLRSGLNEGLMTLFFLLIGLEIRGELRDGALSSARQLAVPVAAAVGGVLVPSVIYLAVTRGTDLQRGWAIPTATDIAFAVGVLSLLGSRVSANLRVLLLALAIVDDIAAILIIAVFYSADIDPWGCAIAAGAAAALFACQRLRLASLWPYILAALVAWLGLLRAGVHPTLSGVVLGLALPADPCARLQRTLHPWVAFAILPAFALANTGIRFDGLSLSDGGALRLTAGIALALLLGKPLGITLFTWVIVKTRLGALAANVTARGVSLVGCLGGVGFTMSLLIATLAFPDSAQLTAAKFAVLAGSSLAGATGLLVGSVLLKKG